MLKLELFAFVLKFCVVVTEKQIVTIQADLVSLDRNFSKFRMFVVILKHIHWRKENAA